MMKKFSSKVVVVGITLMLSLSSSIYAWSYSNYNNGSYVPKSGQGFLSLSTSNGVTRLNTSVYFELDQTNVDNILDYNNGNDNPGTACDNKKAYLTIDQTAIPDSFDLEIDGDEVRTNLPDPKIDIEDNNFFGDDDETEVTVLGTVTSSKMYYMESFWNDYRDGGSGDGGKVNAQFAMSTKGFSDYNNCVQSSVVQHVHNYGKDYGGFLLPETPELTSLQDVNQTNSSNSNISTPDTADLINSYKAIAPDTKSIDSYRKQQLSLLTSMNKQNNSTQTSQMPSDSIAVTITFNKTLSLEELKRFSTIHNLNIEQVQSRALDKTGERITIVTDSLKEVLVNNSELNFMGYTSVKAYISNDQIDTITKDSTAYVIDASGDNAITGLEKDQFAHPLTWLIEDANR